jgi:DNA-binding beta-propeller fold protein YncE
VDAIAFGEGSIWVTTQGSMQLARIDPPTNQVVATFSLNTAVHQLEFGGGALWGRATFSNTIVRIDPVTSAVVATIDVAPPPFSIVYLDDALWSLGENEVSKIDPTTNTVVATVPVDTSGREIVAAGEHLWVTENSSRELIQIDPASATIVARYSLPDDFRDAAIAGSSDAVYLCDCFGEQATEVWRFDLALEELTATREVPGARWIAYMADTLWGVDPANGLVTRVDVPSSAPATPQPSPISTLPSVEPLVTTIPVGQDPEAGGWSRLGLGVERGRRNRLTHRPGDQHGRRDDRGVALWEWLGGCDRGRRHCGLGHGRCAHAGPDRPTDQHGRRDDACRVPGRPPLRW